LLERNNSAEDHERTVMRSFRLRSTLNNQLGKAARKTKVTESSIVSAALVNFLNQEILKPGFVTLTVNQRALRLFLDESENSDSITLMGRNLARMDFPVLFDLLDFESSASSLLRFLEEIAGGRWNWFKFESREQNSQIILYHNYGQKWSDFLNGYVREAFGEIIGVKISTSISENRLRIQILEPPRA
jgi:hypothetical protein